MSGAEIGEALHQLQHLAFDLVSLVLAIALAGLVCVGVYGFCVGMARAIKERRR